MTDHATEQSVGVTIAYDQKNIGQWRRNMIKSTKVTLVGENLTLGDVPKLSDVNNILFKANGWRKIGRGNRNAFEDIKYVLGISAGTNISQNSARAGASESKIQASKIDGSSFLARTSIASRLKLRAHNGSRGRHIYDAQVLVELA
jgi:hypothetical protein